MAPTVFSMIGTKPSLAEQRLEHPILVGRDRSLHDVLAEAPRGVDDHDVGEAGLGIDGEHHARAGEVGAHHLLDSGRERDVHVVEAALVSVRDRAVGEQRGEAVADGVEHVVDADDVQERLLLAREARVGEVLGGRRGAHSDVDLVGAVLGAQPLVGRGDRVGKLLRHLAAPDRASGCGAGLGERRLAGAHSRDRVR